MKNAKCFIMFLVVVIIAGLALTGCGESDSGEIGSGIDTKVKLKIGDLIPDLKFKLHPVSDGQETSLYEIMKERDAAAMVLDFWAVWCEPCKEELPYLETMYREYQDKGLVVLAATIDPYDAEVAIFESLDNSEGTPNDNKIKKSWKKLGEFKAIDGNIITMPVPVDGEREMAKALGVTSIPRTFLIDKDHKLFYQHTGFDEGKVNELKEKVKELMGL